MFTFRQKIFAILALVLVIALSAVWFYKPSGRNFIKNIFQGQKNQQTKNLEIKDDLKLQEQAAEIIKSKNFDRCQEIKDNGYQKVCVNNIALNLAQEQQDLSFCQKLDNALVGIESCEREIIFKKAIDKEDIKVCGETKNSQLKKECEDKFWPDLAIKKGDINVCNDISVESAKENCINTYLLEKEFFANAKEFDCNKFQGDQIRKDCNLFKENLDQGIEFCAKMTSGLFKNYCLMMARQSGVYRP